MIFQNLQVVVNIYILTKSYIITIKYFKKNIKKKLQKMDIQ